MDYCIWSVLETEVYKKPPANLHALELAIHRAWKKLDFAIINSAVHDFKRRLRLCDETNGGYVE